jgi:F1F0 ATPase subunit 2
MEWSDLSPASAGALLGTLFFGGLRFTVSRGLASAWPWLWFLGSMVIRIGVTLAGFIAISGGSVRRLLCCLAGFFALKLLIILPALRKESGRIRKKEAPCT